MYGRRAGARQRTRTNPWRRALTGLTTAGVLALGAVVLAPSAHAATCTDSWTGVGGDGLWTTAANWSNGVVPNGTDVCIGDVLTGTYTVTLNGNANTHSISVGGASGTQTLSMLGTDPGGTFLSFDVASDINANGVLELDLSFAGSFDQLFSLSSTLTNKGVIRTKGVAGQRLVSVGIDNQGTVDLQAADNEFNSGLPFTNTGTVSIASGATLSTNGSFVNNAGTVGNAGGFIIGGGTFSQGAGTVTGNPVTLVSSATWNGVGSGSGSFVLAANNQITGAVAAGQILTVQGTSGIPATLTNAGTIVLDAPMPSGPLVDLGSVAVGGGTLTNTGTLRTTGLGGPVVSVNVVNEGTVDLQAADNLLTSGSTLTNDGTLHLASNATLRADGGVTQSATSTTRFDLASNTVFGRIVTTAVNLAGTADPVLVGGFAPAPHSTFQVITGPHTGDYATVTNTFVSDITDVNFVLLRGPQMAVTGTPPNGTVDNPYTGSLMAANAVAPVSWAVTLGSLPAGLALNATTGAVTGTPTAAGTSTFTVTATDSSTPPQSASQSFSIAIARAPTTTTLTGPASPAVQGTSVTLNASVSGAARTGSVTFFDGATSFASQPLNASGASLTTSALALGPHTLTAVYSGDANYNGSTSNTFSLTIVSALVAPTITSASSTTFTVGTAGSFTATATGNPTPTLSIAGTLPSGVTASGGVLAGTPAAGTAGSYPLTVHATNGVSPDATQAFTLTVAAAANQPPTARISADTLIGEGARVTISGAGSSDPDGTIESYAWSVSAGTLSSTTAVDPSLTVPTFGLVTITLTVTDNAGATNTTFVQVTVVNVAPTVNAGLDLTGTVDVPLSLSASWTDPGTLDTFGATIDWGDGVTDNLGAVSTNPLTRSHTYAAAGTYTAKVCVTDQDPSGLGVGCDTVLITVNPVAANQPPVAVIVPPGSVAEGATLTLSSAGSHDPDGTIVSFAWSVTGGTLTNANTASPTFSAVDNGPVGVTLTVTDDNGAATTTTATVNVTNVAPTVNAGPARTVPAGTALALTVTFSDPGVADAPFTGTVDWGDGSGVAPLGTVTSGFSAMHTYATAGSYTASVCITDKDSGQGCTTVAVTVTPVVVNHAPSVSASAPASGVEGTAVTVSATASDPDGDPVTVSWSLTQSGFDAGASCALSATTGPSVTVTCNDNGSVTVTATASDGSLSAASSATIAVANANPTVTVRPIVGGVAPASVTVTADAADPGRNDTLSCSIAFGNGTVMTAAVTAGVCSAATTVNAPGTYTATVTVTDDNGGTATATGSYTVTATTVVCSTLSGEASAKTGGWHIELEDERPPFNGIADTIDVSTGHKSWHARIATVTTAGATATIVLAPTRDASVVRVVIVDNGRSGDRFSVDVTDRSGRVVASTGGLVATRRSSLTISNVAPRPDGTCPAGDAHEDLDHLMSRGPR